MPEEPILDRELVEEENPESYQQEPEKHSQTSSLGVLASALPSALNSYFGTTTGLDQDRRYKRIVQKKVQSWQRDHPDLFTGDIFIKRRSDGQSIINPELRKFLPSLEESSKRTFAELHPVLNEQYQHIEKKRIYTDPNDDPAIKALRKKTGETAEPISVQETGDVIQKAREEGVPTPQDQAQSRINTAADEGSQKDPSQTLQVIKDNQDSTLQEKTEPDPTASEHPKSEQEAHPLGLTDAAGTPLKPTSTEQSQPEHPLGLANQTGKPLSQSSAYTQAEEDRQKTPEDHYRDFVREHPEKAQGYSSKDPRMKQALEDWKGEEWEKKSSWRKRYDRIQNPHLVPESQRKAWMPKPIRKASDWYDDRTNKLQNWTKSKITNPLKNRYKRSLIGRGMARINNVVDRTLSPITRVQDYINSRIDRAASRLMHQSLRPVRAVGRLGGRGIGRLTQGALRLVSRFLPGLPGIIARGASALAPIFKGSLKGVGQLGGSLLKGGTRRLGMLGARMTAGAVASTAPAWMPFLIIGGIAAGGILFIIIIIIALFGLDIFTPSGNVNVTISKTGPEQVENPQSQDITQPDPSDIAYQIRVGWSGGPNSIVVTDNIPDNTEFVSAGGVGNPTYSDSSRTVTWTITPSTSTNASPSAEYDDSATQNQTPNVPPGVGPLINFNQFIVPALANILPKPQLIQRVHAQTKVDISNYYGAPYYIPQPNGESDIDYSEEAINNANTLGAAIGSIQEYLQTKYPATHVDPFLAVMWTMAIEGSGADPYFWNCNETYKGQENISRGCRGWYNSGNWQVGYGIQVSQAASHLEDDFNQIYGRADASIVQEVGNRVIQGGGITNPSSMPAKSVAQLVQEAGRPGTIFVERPTTDTEAAAQQAIAILLMDPRIGAAAIAQEVAGDIGSNWVANMKGWEQSYYINGWEPGGVYFPNRIQRLAELYTGIGGSIGGGGLGSGSQTLSLVLRPTTPDSWVINYVNARAIGGGGGGSGASVGVPAGSVDGHCTPTGTYPSDLTSELRNKFNITLDGYSENGAKMIYELVTCLTPSRFPTLMEGVSTTIHNFGSIRMSCDGNNCQIWIPENTGAFKFILTHEFGHIVYYTNPRETMRVAQFENAVAAEGYLSPYSGGGNGCTFRGMAEDYAEMVAYYYNPTTGGKTGACDSRDNPPNSLFGTSNFPLHLEVAKTVL